MVKKEFKLLIVDEQDSIFETEEEVEEELGKFATCVGVEDEFIILLNDKVYAKGKFNVEEYNLKDYLIKKRRMNKKSNPFSGKNAYNAGVI